MLWVHEAWALRKACRWLLIVGIRDRVPTALPEAWAGMNELLAPLRLRWLPGRPRPRLRPSAAIAGFRGELWGCCRRGDDRRAVEVGRRGQDEFLPRQTRRGEQLLRRLRVCGGTIGHGVLELVLPPCHGVSPRLGLRLGSRTAAHQRRGHGSGDCGCGERWLTFR